MTEIKKRAEPTLATVLGFAALLILIFNTESALGYAKDGLALCARTLIPSLFPFMVISDILVRAGACTVAARLFERPMRLLFGISGEGAGAMALGALCGFPIGARCAVSLCDNGEISRAECERLICFSNNPSVAFIVSAVGLSLFGSKRIGAELCVITFVSSLAVGALFCRLGKKEDMTERKGKRTEKPRGIGIKDLSEAVSGSAQGVIKVCAFVVFFSVVLGMIKSAALSLGSSRTATALALCIVELTGGVAEAAGLDGIALSYTLAAFALGWSGLSVHFQIMSVCSGRGLSLWRYLSAKLFQGTLSALLAAIRAAVFPLSLETSGDSSALVSSMPNALCAAVLVIFCLSLTVAIAKRLKR